MSTRNHLTDRVNAADVAHIKALNRSGMSPAEIARRYDMSDASAARILRPDTWTAKQHRIWGGGAEPLLDDPEQVVVPLNPEPTTRAEPMKPDKPAKIGLMKQVRMFDDVRNELHDGLKRLKHTGTIKPAIYDEMIDEMLDELASWKSNSK